MRCLALGSVFLLAFCQGTEVPRQNAEEKPIPAPQVALPVPDVKGTWQVIALNGRPPNPTDAPIIVTFDDREIAAHASCVKWFWAYRVSGAALSTKRTRLSEEVCARGLSVAETLFVEITSGARQLRHLTDGGLYITNRTETMVLRRSADSRSGPLIQ